MLYDDVKQVFIGGGGEMATAREVLKHFSVEVCVMVDLDKVRIHMQMLCNTSS
jgi:thermospermine synthase